MTQIPSTLQVIFVLSAAGAASCLGLSDLPGTAQCYLHCWSYEFELTDDDANGYFDSPCTNHWTGAGMQAPIPDSGRFVARTCLHLQAEHDGVKEVLQAMEDGTTASVSEQSRSAWKVLVAQLQDDAYAQCLNHVTGSPGYQDIDDLLGGSQACITTSGDIVCKQQVVELLGEALELHDEALAPLPIYAGVEWGVAYAPECSYVPEVGDTGFAGTGETGTSGSDGGADTTSGAGAMHLEELIAGVSCTGSRCRIDGSARDHFAAGLGVLIDEGVMLKLAGMNAPCAGTGLRLTGLDAGELGRELADQLGLRNGDWIAKVEGVVPADARALTQIVNDLQSTADPVEFTVRRVTQAKCMNIEYSIEFIQ